MNYTLGKMMVQAAGRDVDGTARIESYLFVARSVSKMFKIIPICSTYVANIIGRFENKNFQNQRSLFEASRRRWIELHGRSIIIE